MCWHPVRNPLGRSGCGRISDTRPVGRGWMGWRAGRDWSCGRAACSTGPVCCACDPQRSTHGASVEGANCGTDTGPLGCTRTPGPLAGRRRRLCDLTEQAGPPSRRPGHAHQRRQSPELGGSQHRGGAPRAIRSLATPNIYRVLVSRAGHDRPASSMYHPPVPPPARSAAPGAVPRASGAPAPRSTSLVAASTTPPPRHPLLAPQDRSPPNEIDG